MKMDVRHDLPAAAAVAWRELHSDAYAAAAREKTNTTSELISEETRPDGKTFRRTRVTLGKDLPSAAASLLGSKRLSYVLEEEISPATMTTQWRVIVEKVSDKVKAAGMFRIEPSGEAACRRVVQGEVKVNVPLVGGKIEQGIAAELEKSYEATALFAREWLSRQA